jgi:two-component system, chemotaxis family, CheB/CheR fusion protein
MGACTSNSGHIAARLAAIVESSDDAIVGKSLDGIVTSWNAGAERLFGYTAEEMIGQPIARLVPLDRRDDLPQILDSIRRGVRVDHFETERIRKDGRRIYVSLTISPIRDDSGVVVGASKIARDVTERKATEREREQLLGIAQRAWAQAEAASRAKDEFLAMLGHELRNPLAAVHNAIGAARLEPRNTERALAIAARQADQLARLVDDLLDVANITQDRIRLNVERVSVREVVERAVEATRHVVDARGLSLTVAPIDAGARVNGDPTRLEQVFANLLGNAAKYTERGGHVEVHCERVDEDAVIRVRDDGIGISRNLLPRIFDLFVQAERTLDRSQGGLGIGLTVVRSLVALHGGRVTAYSEGPGRGAEFVVHLPLASSDAASPFAPLGGDREPFARTRVLIVEDNADAAEGLMMLIEAYGHEVRVSHDGVDALAAAESWSPDLMLVDIGLPGIDGYEFARRARGAPALSGIPLIALTGYGKDEDRERTRDAGFAHHLVKPVDPTELRVVLKEYRAKPSTP